MRVLVNIDPAAEPLVKYLEPADEYCSTIEFEKMRYGWYKTVVFPCNWKLALEACNEAYHVQATHRQFPESLRALCLVLAFSGCRVSEALALTVHHIDAERLTLTFKTLKRRRLVFRVVPVPQTMIDLLRKLQPDGEGHLWQSHRVTAWRLVKATMDRAAISGPMSSPKGLRHSFGIRAATQNVPTTLIQRWMGHASATTTAIYLDAVGTEERQFASRMW